MISNTVDAPPPPRAAPADVGPRDAEKCGGTTIAVMPIRNSADDADDDVYAEGLSDDLAAAMARSPGVRAVSHYTQLHHGRQTDLSASELGVDAVLRVAVGRFGANVGVTIELCDHRGLVV